MNELRNAKILRIQKVHDYWQIFTDKGIVNCYNPAIYRTTTGDSLDLEHWRDIVNRVVTNILIIEEKALCFVLDNESSIEISLAPGDYFGPEAFEISLDSGVTIVD